MSGTKEKKKDDLTSAVNVGASGDIVQRYGGAVKEYNTAYSGHDYENGIELTKSLKSISEQKTNPDFVKQNLKQKSGFGAEVVDTARTNADNNINGNPTRKTRTDDIGSVNDPLRDHVLLNKDGNIIPGSGSQMKFIGSTPEESWKKVMSAKCQKYVDNDIPIEVPSDYYDKMLESANSQIDDLKRQLENRLAKGDTESARRLQEKLSKCEKARDLLRKSKVSSKEAEFAITHPKMFTAREVIRTANSAGLKAAKGGALVGGSISLVRNAVALIKGDIEAGEAAKNIAKDTATGAANAYVVTAGGTVLKGALQNTAKGSIANTISKTNLPTAMVSLAVSSAKTLKRFFSGKITGLECLEELGQSGTTLVASSVFSTLGGAAATTALTGVVSGTTAAFIGGMLGGMIGYALASACYGTLVSSLREAKLAREEREMIEAECEKQIALIREYRLEMERSISENFLADIDIFQSAFDGIKNALQIGDADGFIAGANSISAAFGREAQYKNMEEFDEIMSSDVAFKL